MTLATFSHFSTFAPGIAPPVTLEMDTTELGLVLAATGATLLCTMLARALLARLRSTTRRSSHARRTRATRAGASVRPLEASR